mgnify:FL=1
MVSGKRKVVFFTGILMIALSLFLPFASGKESLMAWNFSLAGISLPFIIIPLALVCIAAFTFRKVFLTLSLSLALLLLDLILLFSKEQWKPALKSKFFLDFLKVAGVGWYLLAAGASLIIVVSITLFRDRKRAPYLFLLPMLAGIGFLTFFPALFALFIRFRRWNILIVNKPFVGLANFEKAFSDEYFWRSIWISFKYALGVIPAKILIAFFFAFLIYAIPKFKGFFRVVYFLPTVTSVVAVSVIWNWIYNPYYGVSNYVLSVIGVPPVNWLGNPKTAIWAVAAVAVWRGVGYDIVIFLAGLNDIPKTTVEASQIDGANGWQRLRHILIPLMKPSLVFVFITSTIGAIQVFSEIYMMTGGNAETKTAVYYIWEYGFSRLQMGYASTMSLILFAIILTISLIQMRATRLLKEE